MIPANAPDFRAALDGLELVDHPVQLKQHRRDFYWYSPILKRALDGKVADLQLAFKRQNDPLGLLNPGKMTAWSAAPCS